MRIGRIKRLQITYALWKALGAKNRNAVFAVVHEGGFADIVAGQLPVDTLKKMQMEMESARGYDHGSGNR